jgi:hypothetical protein
MFQMIVWQVIAVVRPEPDVVHTHEKFRIERAAHSEKLKLGM